MVIFEHVHFCVLLEVEKSDMGIPISLLANSFFLRERQRWAMFAVFKAV